MALSTTTLLALLVAASAFAAPTLPTRRPAIRKEIKPIVPDVSVNVLSKVDALIQPITVPRASLTELGGANSITDVNQLQCALDFVSDLLASNIFGSYEVKDSYVSQHNGVMHVYLRQVVNELEVINGDLNVNVLADGSILSSGNSFFAGSEAPEPYGETLVPRLSAMEALQKFGSFIGEHITLRSKSFFSTGAMEVKLDDNSSIIRDVPFAESDVKARRVYIQTEDGVLRLGWELIVEMQQNMFYSVVDELNGAILNVNDWVYSSGPTYRVLPFGVEDPTEGQRELVEAAPIQNASPLGWHDNGVQKFTDTRGNNIDAYSPYYLNPYRRPDGGSELLFDNPARLDVDDPSEYFEAATTQLFHTLNRYHDILYQLGFNEVAGNFQTNNFGKGGKGNDAVISAAQMSGNTNNADFTCPADGTAPRLNMYIWTKTKPYRDGDFNQGIMIHEYTHGLSNRLTGGPSNVNCLPSGEAGGMGEGWGDAFAHVLNQKAEYTRNTVFGLASYVTNKASGIRKYPYTSDMKVDPETYKYIKNFLTYSDVHSKGEVWAGILHEVYWNLREARGFEPDLLSIDVSTPEARANAKGDVIFMLNLVDGMKVQPCKPNFVQARDAILAADGVNFGGANVCLMWKGFAVRGLGYSAKKGGSEAFDLPPNCK